VKRVNLLDYFELGEVLQTAQKALSVDKAQAGDIFLGLMGLPSKLEKFIEWIFSVPPPSRRVAKRM
jgi:hypothetical protein